jgi:hypothetical protein
MNPEQLVSACTSSAQNQVVRIDPSFQGLILSLRFIGKSGRPPTLTAPRTVLMLAIWKPVLCAPKRLAVGTPSFVQDRAIFVLRHALRAHHIYGDIVTVKQNDRSDLC